MNALKAILFDLDDTLYPELAFVRSGFRHVAAACAARFSLDAEQVYREFFDHHRAGKRGKIFDAWLDVHHLPLPEHRDWMVAAYRHHEPTISTHDGVEPLLRHLGDKGLALGVISDGPWRMQRNKFAALGIAKYFTHVQFTDELGREKWKPHPAAFEIALAALRLPAEQAIYVGDNPQKDFLGARQVGLGTVRVRYAGGIYAGIEPPSARHRPQAEISDLTELPALLDTFPRPLAQSIGTRR